MALTVTLPVRSGPNLGTFAHPLKTALEANNSTYKVGAVLVINASGLLAEAGVNPVSILGVACAQGQNGTSKTNQYHPAADHLVFEGQLDTTAGSYVSLQTDLGAQYGITKDGTSGFWFVDTSKTAANARVIVVDFRDVVGTTAGRCYFMFKQQFTAYN